METLEPLADRVVIEPVKKTEITKGGIFLPEAAREKQQRGTVISVGKGRVDGDGKHVAMNVSQGDKVLFAKYSGVEIKADKQDLVILKESDILAIVHTNGAGQRET